MRVRALRGILVAGDYFTRLRGLMARGFWPTTCRGIYFPRCASVHTFFTFLKPDILFLDKNLKILKIFPSAGPWRVWIGPSSSRHCLELPEGTSRRLGLKNGVKISFI